jgi:hypothetical protein
VGCLSQTARAQEHQGFTKVQGALRLTALWHACLIVLLVDEWSRVEFTGEGIPCREHLSRDELLLEPLSYLSISLLQLWLFTPWILYLPSFFPPVHCLAMVLLLYLKGIPQKPQASTLLAADGQIVTRLIDTRQRGIRRRRGTSVLSCLVTWGHTKRNLVVYNILSVTHLQNVTDSVTFWTKTSQPAWGPQKPINVWQNGQFVTKTSRGSILSVYMPILAVFDFNFRPVISKMYTCRIHLSYYFFILFELLRTHVFIFFFQRTASHLTC